jgi:hypothetical protein
LEVDAAIEESPTVGIAAIEYRDLLAAFESAKNLLLGKP